MITLWKWNDFVCVYVCICAACVLLLGTCQRTHACVWKCSCDITYRCFFCSFACIFACIWVYICLDMFVFLYVCMQMHKDNLLVKLMFLSNFDDSTLLWKYPSQFTNHIISSVESQKGINVVLKKPEGWYCCTKSIAITPFWLSTEHLWTALTHWALDHMVQ